MLKMRVAGVLLAVACATGITANAQAGQIGLNFFGTSGVGHQGLVGITYQGDAWSGTFQRNVRVQSLSYEVTSVSGLAANYLSVGQQLTVYCTDIFEGAKSGTVNFGSVANAPDPINPMGEARAGLMSVLYALYHASTIGHNANTAAFQMAVWEIGHEDNFDADAETFALANLDSLDADSAFFTNNATIGAAANEMLEGAWEAWRDGHNGLTIMAAYTKGFQDVIIIVPLPAPVWMGLAGLLGVGLIRKRYMR